MEALGRLDIFGEIVSTGILLVSLFCLRVFASRMISRWKFPNPEIKRRWIVQVRNLTLFFLFVGLLFVWATALKEFAVSIVAFAVALVIATKEILLCISGGILKYSGNMFSVGDRVEIGEIRGDVVGHNFFATTIYEIGPGRELHQFTGRVVVVPNSLFLSTAVYNETETGNFSLHVFRVPYHRNDDWRSAANKLLDAAKIECSGYLEEARSQFEKLASQESLEIPKIEPRIQIHYPDADRVDLVVRMPVPARAKGRIEQAVLMRFSGFELGSAPH